MQSCSQTQKLSSYKKEIMTNSEYEIILKQTQGNKEKDKPEENSKMRLDELEQ